MFTTSPTQGGGYAECRTQAPGPWQGWGGVGWASQSVCT